MFNPKYRLATAIVALSVLSSAGGVVFAQGYQPGSNLTIHYNANYPTRETLEQMHGELFFQSAVQVMLWAQPIAAVAVGKAGFEAVGITNTTIPIAEQRSPSSNVIATANQETIYAYGWTEIGDEPMVFEIAPGTLGFMADAWQRPIVDLGLTGPDKGEGGKYIIVPPGYTAGLPETSDGVFVFNSPTKTVFWLQRAFVKEGVTEEGATNILKEHSRIYPLSEGPPKQQHFVNLSVTPYNGMADYQGMDLWHTIDKMIQLEPVQERDLAMMGLAKTIGIEKGKTFAPTAAEIAILLRAQDTARAMMIAMGFDSRKEGIATYEGLQWESAFQTESPYFDGQGHTETHERAAFTYQAMTGAKSMVAKMVGKGSQYQLAAKDSSGAFFDGANTYQLTIPANVPVNNYWSIAIYDTETRSLIENGTPKSSTGSHLEIDKNEDGTMDLFFGPSKPEGVKEENFVLTKNGEGWFAYFRFYGPEQAFFDKTWQPNDFELVSN